MNKEKNIFETLRILSLLNNEAKEIEKITKTETFFLKVKKSFLKNGNISLNDFLFSLKELSKYKYIFYISFFDEDKTKEVKNTYTNKKFRKNLDKFYEEIYKGLLFLKPEDLKKAIPEYFEGETKIDLVKEDFLKFMKKFENEFSLDIIAYVFLLPLKNIDDTIKKMNNGQTFKEINQPKLYFNDAYKQLFIKRLRLDIRNKYVTYAQIIKYIMNTNPHEWHEYEDIPFFNGRKSNKQYKDSCAEFNKRVAKETKNKIKKFFLIEKYQVKINPDVLI